LSSKDAKEVCTLCGLNKAPKCEDGAIKFGPCAFGACDNIKTLEHELWGFMKDCPFKWQRVRGSARSWKGTKYLVHAVGIEDNVMVLCRLPNGKMMSKPKDSFSDIEAIER